LTLAAAGSIISGALGALQQKKIKRFIGYTAVNQMGFLFLGLSCFDLNGLTASFFYLFYYLITTFSFFSIILYIKNLKTDTDLLFILELSFLSQKNKYIALLLSLLFFSMAGLPPFGGFFAKFLLFLAVYKGHNCSLLFLAVATNAISGYYYLRIIKLMFFEKSNFELDRLKKRGVSLFIEQKFFFFLFLHFFWLVVAVIIIFYFFCVK
jgi:NADH-quinone oxidoreductase subunit N